MSFMFHAGNACTCDRCAPTPAAKATAARVAALVTGIVQPALCPACKGAGGFARRMGGELVPCGACEGTGVEE